MYSRYFFLFGQVVSKNSLSSLNEFHTDIKFTYESSKESIACLDLKVSVKNSNFNISITCLLIQTTPNDLQSLARFCVLVGCALIRKTL